MIPRVRRRATRADVGPSAARYGLAAALLLGAAAVSGCSGQPAGSSDITVCGTTLWQSGESIDPHHVPAAKPGPGTPAAPATSQLPPSSNGAPVGSAGLAYVPAIVLVTDDCSADPIVTVTPANAATTYTVAHTTGGGVAGLYLGLSKDAVTIRVYENGTLTGQLTLP